MLCVCVCPFCVLEKNKNHCTSSSGLSHSLSSIFLPFMSFLPILSLSDYFLLSFFSYLLPLVSLLSSYLPPLPHHHLALMGHYLSVRGWVWSQGTRVVSSVCDSQGAEGLSRGDNLGQLSSVITDELGGRYAYWMDCGGQSPLRAS